MDDRRKSKSSWRFSRQVNLAVLIQLALLAGLIIGSWFNLQRQLDLLQRDVTMLLAGQENFQRRLETLQASSISYEYRLRALEKQISQTNNDNRNF
jgi:uncharacterized membrane protein YqgA involved in biofilm formation